MKLKGINASDGIAISKVFKYEEVDLNIEKKLHGNISEEIEKLKSSLIKTREQLENIKLKAVKSLGEEKAAIFDAHILLLEDPELIDKVVSMIEVENVSAQYAVDVTTNSFIKIFESMDNEYMKERASDIADVKVRILSNILEKPMTDLTLIDEEVIIVAKDLAPSDTALLDKNYVNGFITEIGGRTSHSAIMARSLEIPAIVGVSDLLNNIKHGDLIILDGYNGDVLINPNEQTLLNYKDKKRKLLEEEKLLLKYKKLKTETKCGKHIELCANIGSNEDLELVIENGAEGIGLFRTEFLYMGKSTFPTEEEQFNIYKEVLSAMGDKPVVVRTLDIGGDKELPYLNLPKELNPFLGYRAIRMCLNRKDIFKVQARALIRASVFGNLKIMFPMIATVDEFLEAKNFFKEVEEELIKEGVEIAAYEIGMMVEIPAAAILADKFAKYVDFFSIGTNDLIQYTFAADRMNEHVSYLYQPLNPSLLKLIQLTIEGAHKEGKWVGMCGEVAGDKDAIEILIGLGMDELSMSASSILKNRHLISNIEMKEAKILSEKALNCFTNDEVYNLVRGI